MSRTGGAQQHASTVTPPLKLQQNAVYNPVAPTNSYRVVRRATPQHPNGLETDVMCHCNDDNGEHPAQHWFDLQSSLHGTPGGLLLRNGSL